MDLVTVHTSLRGHQQSKPLTVGDGTGEGGTRGRDDVDGEGSGEEGVTRRVESLGVVTLRCESGATQVHGPSVE